jgi:acid phosphatase (class A)
MDSGKSAYRRAVKSGNLPIKSLWFFSAVLVLLIPGGPLAAQNPSSPLAVLTSHPRQQPGANAVGFLEKNAASYLLVIPPYPVIQSLEDEADVAGVWQWKQSGDSPRWQLAEADDRVSYERFAEAYGSKIDSATTPLLVHLLDRVEADLSVVLGSAKKSYNRPRPYQRFQMAQVCGFDSAPLAEASPKGGNSYPSGHATFGWSVALLLAEIAPERAQIILARGREYGESRIVCAVHYPSDVHAGELLASAVVARLYAVPEFRRELSCAQQERAMALKIRDQLAPECQTLIKQ